MQDTGVILDSKTYSKDTVFKVSPFHINTKNIQEAYYFMKEKGVKLVSDIQLDHYFNFEDPDGNRIMRIGCGEQIA
jgi:hypothetical protein